MPACDLVYGGAGQGIEIDPPGAWPPDTLTFWDTTGGDFGCLDRDVWQRI